MFKLRRTGRLASGVAIALFQACAKGLALTTD